LLGTSLAAAWLPTAARASDVATIERIEEPIELEGAAVPSLLGHSVDDFAVYKWDGEGFQAIPFQVDERGPGGGYFGEEAETGYLDDNDQIVFMIEDAGDRARTDAWLDHANVDPDHRYQIEVEDPLNPGQKGWVYLFLGADLPRSADDYVELISDNPLIVGSDRYREEYFPDLPGAQSGLFLLPGIGGNEVDVNDRMKFRLKLSPLFDWQTEEDGQVEETNTKDGPVRVIVAYNISLPIIGFTISNTQVLYHRQMSIVRNKISQLNYPEAKRMLWLSDNNYAIKDFMYYDNRGGDPEEDATFSDVVDGDGLRDEGEPFTFQEVVSPTQGATVSVQDNSIIPAETTLAYYCDECGSESWPETGDGHKWGENGTWLKNIPFQAETFDLESWNWRLPTYADGSHGGLYARRYFHRVTIAADWQAANGVADEAPGAVAPTALRLEQNQPNPFNPRTTIRFAVPVRSGAVSLDIYDAAGRRVRRLVQGRMTPGMHALTWDGKDDAGRDVASGVYAYRLETAEQSLTRRMLLLK
jgi:hypothetical protein